MKKNYIATVLLIATVGLFVGCGTVGDKDIVENEVKEITLATTQQNQNNEQTDSQNQNNVQVRSQSQNNSQNTNTSQTDLQTHVSLSLEDVKKLVLDRVPGAAESDVLIELDYDDGHYVYEGEILYDQKEYEFEIDANTGTFLEWSEETR